jgi:hypothetical protein
MATLMKIVGIVWMILSVLLILVSALTYAREADSLWSWISALMDFFDPSRILNSIVILAFILPGFLIFQFGQRLSTRQSGRSSFGTDATQP